MNIPWDETTIKLTAERDIVSDSVRVTVRATLAIGAEDSTRVRPLLDAALAAVLEGDWRFSGIERQEDQSGMESIVALASVRVKEHQTGGLVERIKKASRPGLKLSLVGVLTRPPRSEIDKARYELRTQLYEAPSARPRRSTGS